ARHTELAHDLPHMNFDGTFPHPAGAQWPCSCRLDSGVRGPPAASLLDCDFWLRLPNLFFSAVAPAHDARGDGDAIDRPTHLRWISLCRFVPNRHLVLPPLARFWGAISSALVTLWPDKK